MSHTPLRHRVHASILVLSRLRDGLSLAGSAGLLFGMVKPLRGLADLSALGPALAAAVLPWLHALVLAEVLLSPRRSRLRRRHRRHRACRLCVDSSASWPCLRLMGVGFFLSAVLVMGA